MNKIKIFVIFVSLILSSFQTGFALFERFFEKLPSRFVYSTYEDKGFDEDEKPYFQEEIRACDEEADSLAGTISFFYRADASDCYIARLLVKDNYREKGLGTELGKRVLFRLINIGCREVRWQAHPFMRNLTQEQLNAFYAKRGAKRQNDSDYNDFVYKIGPFAKTRILIRIKALACQKKLMPLFLHSKKLGEKEDWNQFIYTIPNN